MQLYSFFYLLEYCCFVLTWRKYKYGKFLKCMNNFLFIHSMIIINNVNSFFFLRLVFWLHYFYEYLHEICWNDKIDFLQFIYFLFFQLFLNLFFFVYLKRTKKKGSSLSFILFSMLGFVLWMHLFELWIMKVMIIY